MIDILLNDDLSQVEIIDKVKNILGLVESNFVDKNNLDVFKDFIKAFLNNGDFLLDIVSGVETLKSVIKNGKTELEGLTDDDKEKNWFVPVLDNLCKLLINSIDSSKDFVAHIKEILMVYKNFAKSIDIPANAKCCKDAFLDLEDNSDVENIWSWFDNNSILQKINAVESVREKYDALQKFFDGKNELVHDKDETKDDFKQVEKLYKNFMQEFNASNIILTKEEQRKFNKFRFTFEINQTEAVNYVKCILEIINKILYATPKNKQQENLAYIKKLLKSVIKDGRILKFITASDELKAIHPILSNAFEELAKLIVLRIVEIKIGSIEGVGGLNEFVANDINGLLNEYNAFASYLDSDSKNNPDYQTNIIISIQSMINYMKTNFLINDNQESKTAYQNLLKAFFSSIKNEDKSNIPETNILTFVIDKIDYEAIPKTSKAALKRSLICLMPLIQNSVGKEKFEDNLFQLFNSYKVLAKELDKSFDFQAAKDFVGNQDIKNKYVGNEELKRAFDDLSKEINKLVPDTKKIMHKYKLFRNKIQEITNTGNKSFELTKPQKDIFEKFELDQNKAISAIKNILMSISEFCPNNKGIQNENNIINEDDINKKNNILANSDLINTDINNKDNELNNDNEKPFNKVLINLLQGGDFLKDIIKGIDSTNGADMSDDLKNYLMSLCGPLCEFLISYLEQTKDIPKEITTRFDYIMSKYLEITNIINAEKVDIAKLFESIGNLLRYLEKEIISKDKIVFNTYKNLFKNIAVQAGVGKNENIVCLLARTIKQNLTEEQRKKAGKYLDFVSEYTTPIFTHVASLMFDSANGHDFFSRFVSKFEKVYSMFNKQKSFTQAVKSLFSSGTKNSNKRLKLGSGQNAADEDENQIFRYIVNKLEFERPIKQIENKENNVVELSSKFDDSDEKNIISTSLKNQADNLISPVDSVKILDEKKEIKNDDDTEKIYLSEALLANSWSITKWFLKKYFNGLKDYVNQAKDDDEILTTLTNSIDLTNPMGKYVTFWRITNLLFWRKSKLYYPVVVGEIILSLTIFSPFTVIAGLHALGKYFWTWMFEKNDKPPIPPGGSPRQSENSPDQNIVIGAGMKQNNEENESDKTLVVNELEKKEGNIIMPESNTTNDQISIN